MWCRCVILDLIRCGVAWLLGFALSDAGLAPRRAQIPGRLQARRLVETGGKVPLRPLPGFRISFKICFGNLLLKRLEASLELGFGHG